MEHTFEVPVRGRFGVNRGDAFARITCYPDECDYVSVRIDDKNNLEFWCEMNISKEDVLKLAECLKRE